jgi:hypothetical protein
MIGKDGCLVKTIEQCPRSRTNKTSVKYKQVVREITTFTVYGLFKVFYTAPRAIRKVNLAGRAERRQARWAIYPGK